MNIKEYLKDNILYLDGGMGTLLQGMGLSAGELPERWNLTHAECIKKIHLDYYRAGADVVSANTFGANILKYSEEELEGIISAAIENARAAAKECGDGRDKYVALDIGPTGKMLKPLGDFEFEDAVSVFKKTVDLGVKYGADLIFIETMSDSYEAKAALLAAKENSQLPVFVSCAFSEDGKLMTGASPSAMVTMLEGMGADAIGVNCSLGPKALFPVVNEYLKYASVPVILKPNAGLPRTDDDGRCVYDIDPAEFSRQCAGLVREGVRIVGGCCGTTPEYIKALVSETRGIAPIPLSEKDITAVSSYTHSVVFDKKPILIGERINPTGKKRFKEALIAGDIDYILKEGLSQEECGVDILDVNVGLPDIDEASMLTRAVRELQAVSDLPLQIDTTDIASMEAALRIYNGKAMVNSVNGKAESMHSVFPLVKKYGGLVVALTLDEKGIPDTAEGRVEIARRILQVASEYGIKKKDIIFDPLAMTISADKDAARVTLDAVEIIHKELGAHTSLGISNVSFGLPHRDGVNSAFYSMALTKGLSAAILNPYSDAMMRTYHSYMALSGYDDNCARYIDYIEKHPAQTVTEVNVSKKEFVTDEKDGLFYAITHGLSERATAITEKLVMQRDGLAIVEQDIIPALDSVGVGFEEKRIYLPQLLMSAEAAGAAFDVIRKNMPERQESNGEGIVLATVKGDIHDIGKNIVKLLLQNYGYNVIDLGRDVDAESVVSAARDNGVRLVGLSALMTTTVPSMKQTIEALHKALPQCKVVVGGAVLTPEYAQKIGADRYAKDAMETVRIAEEILGKQ